MIIYVESGTRNITDQRILQEMSYVESQLNPYLSDSINDDVIYILSLSTVLKEVNSSAPRVREAFINELGQLGCAAGQDECASAQAAEALNDLIAQTDEQFGGSYEIPSQPTIDLVIGCLLYTSDAADD